MGKLSELFKANEVVTSALRRISKRSGEELLQGRRAIGWGDAFLESLFGLRKITYDSGKAKRLFFGGGGFSRMDEGAIKALSTTERESLAAGHHVAVRYSNSQSGSVLRNAAAIGVGGGVGAALAKNQNGRTTFKDRMKGAFVGATVAHVALAGLRSASFARKIGSTHKQLTRWLQTRHSSYTALTRSTKVGTEVSRATLAQAKIYGKFIERNNPQMRETSFNNIIVKQPKNYRTLWEKTSDKTYKLKERYQVNRRIVAGKPVNPTKLRQGL